MRNVLRKKLVGLLFPAQGSFTFLNHPLRMFSYIKGQLSQATPLYATIEASSSEAQSYLARKAFRDKDWLRARYLTEKLLKQYPNNALLNENLKKIAEEEKRG